MEFRLFHGSIRKKLTSIIVLATLPVFILLLSHEFDRLSDSVKGARQDLNIYLHSFSEIQRRITGSTQTLLHTVSAMSEIKKGEKEASQNILAAVLEANPIYSNAILLDPRGDVVAMGKGKDKGFNFADRKQFKDAVRTKSFAYGEFVIGKATKKSIFPFAMPVLDQQKGVLGVLIVGVELSLYADLFDQSKFPQGAFFGLCDQNGIRLFRYPHIESVPIGKPIKKSVFAAAVAAGKTGFISVEASDGINRIIAYEPLRIQSEDAPYMYMFMGLDQEKLLADVYWDLIKGGVVSALSLLVALFIGWMLGGREVAVRIDKLALAATSIGKGEHSSPTGEDYSDGELGQLFEAFDTMASLLQRREDDLNAAKDNVEAVNRALQMNMAQLRTLVETMPEIVWLKNVSGVYVFCNHKFERLYGASESEIIGKSDYDLVDKERADFFRKHDLAAMQTGGPTVNEETLTYRDDGHVEYLETIKTPLFDEEGQVIGVLGVSRDITERKRVADELRESEMRFKALHNASFGGIAIHDKGLILDCNNGLSIISGFSIEELVGMDGLLLIEESSRELVRTNILRGYEKPYEALGVRKSGEVYPLQLEARNIPYQGKLLRVVEFSDITERKIAEEKLRDSELRHRVIFENSPLGMIRFSKDGVILDCNDRFVDLMGATREELIGFNSSRNSSPEMRDALNKALAGEPSSFENYYTSVMGNKTSYLHVVFNPVNKGSSPTEVIATLEDVSKRKQVQDELQTAKDQAESFSKSKTEFLTNMSHEIRTPLNGILGMLQLMETTGLNEEQTEYASAAVRSSKRLTSLLSDILDLSRVEAGKLVVQHRPFNLPDTLEQVCDLYNLTAEQGGVELKCEIDPNLPNIVLGDSIRLQQVLTNLIGNAYKFTSEGYIEVQAHVLPVQRQGQSSVLFSVSDTGTGIADDKLGTLFDSFTQVSNGYTRAHQGAGLGLAICKQLADLMGGGLAIESEEGVGTTLFVSLPFDIGDEFDSKSLPMQEERDLHVGHYRILLAEDERVNSIVTQRLLEKDGHIVSVVENGEKAVHALQSEDFDIVLMDIQMPVMDGVEATRSIRAGEAGEHNVAVPIIALTAYAMVGDKEKFIGVGMDGYVVKPIVLNELRKAMAGIMSAGG